MPNGKRLWRTEKGGLVEDGHKDAVLLAYGVSDALSDEDAKLYKVKPESTTTAKPVDQTTAKPKADKKAAPRRPAPKAAEAPAPVEPEVKPESTTED